MNGNSEAISIYYEHPEWFRPLFDALARRGVPFEAVTPGSEVLDPALETWPHPVVFNRMSPSAHLRGGAQAIRYTLQYLGFLEDRGVRVINGRRAFEHEVSKVRQLSLLSRLGLSHPATRVVHDPARLAEAADGLVFPLVVKPNVGGSGSGIARFDALAELEEAVRAGGIAPSLDGTLLLQEYHPPEGGHITRVEVLGGRFLYAIRVDATGDGFNLCPADLCRTDGQGSAEAGSPVPARACRPPDDVVAAVLRLTAAAGMELGGVEYLVSARDGRRYYYDVNALSNFVAEAPRVVGFDPFERLVDYLVSVLALARTRVAVGA